MLTKEEIETIMDLVGDLETDLRNGNVPAAKLLIVSLSNHLARKVPLDWHILGNFLIDSLDDASFRIAVLQLVHAIKEAVWTVQPDQETVQG